MSKLRKAYSPSPDVIPGLEPGIQLTTSALASREVDPGDEHRDGFLLRDVKHTP